MGSGLRLKTPAHWNRALAALAEPGVAWLALAALLAAGALLAWFMPTAALDWQPALAAREPWRWWSAAFVHWSAQHLLANLLGAALVGAFGFVGRVPLRTTLAWFVAWPLMHLALLLQPALLHYGGLSGVLHAGVAAAVVELLLTSNARTQRYTRAIAAAVCAGLVLKVVLEAPWGAPLRHPADWDIAIAPLAHASGAIAGSVLALLAWLLPSQSKP